MTALLKPAIHPKCFKDESPIGYLVRLAKRNDYDSYRWLLNTDNFSRLNNLSKLFNELDKSEWSGFQYVDELVREVSQLLIPHLLNKLRYCPICLDEYSYWRAAWHMKVSVVCNKHKVWLVDRCPCCQREIRFGSANLNRCKCGGKLSEAKVESCPKEAVLMQCFLEDKPIYPEDSTPLLMRQEHGLSLIVRSQILLLFARLQPTTRIPKTGINTNLLKMESAKLVMKDTAEALFAGTPGFWGFMQRIHKWEYGGRKQGDDLFTQFYRQFYEYCPQICFDPYKDLLEDYLSKHWSKPLSRRNSLFSKDVIQNHAWVPLQQACREYDISKSTIRRAISDKLICAKVDKKEKKNWILVYRPDIESRIHRLKDTITALEAAVILGVTKAQFRQLRENGCFKYAIPLKEGYCTHWQFSRQEILRFLDEFITRSRVLDDEYLSMPDVLKHFGGQLDKPLVTVLDAIRNGELPAGRVKFGKGTGIRSLVIKRGDFLSWYEKSKLKSDRISVPMAAKRLGINQEFAYQLVKQKLLRSSLDDGRTKRWISEGNLEEFQARYVLLSKLSKAMGIGSRALMDYLASREIRPVDYYQEEKLRQKVYDRLELFNISMTGGVISRMEDWS